MRANPERSERRASGDGPSGKYAFIGFVVWAFWAAAWLAAAFVYGRPVTYTIGDARAVTLDAERASMTLTKGEVVVNQIDGWKVHITRIDPASSARMGPDVTDLEALTRQAVRDAVSRPRGSASEQPSDPKDSKDPREPKDYTQSAVQQNRPAFMQQLLDTLSYEQSALSPPAVAVAPDGSTVAWIVGNALFTVPARTAATTASRLLLTGPITAPSPVIITRLRAPRCVPELDTSILVVACEGGLEIREPRSGRLRGSVDGRFKTLRTGDGEVFAASDNQLFGIRESGDSLDRIDTPLPSAPRAVARGSEGRRAIATDDGNVVVTGLDGMRVTIRAPGAVDALAFLGTETVVVGGAFRGIHVIGLRQDATPLVADVIGTRFLSLPSATQVAYATADRVAVRPWSARRAFGTRGYIFAGIALLPVALVIGFVVSAFGSPGSTTGPATSSVPAADTQPRLNLPLPEPPPGLVQACTEGECVLYAGAGMSAQAGYPTWNPFVADLLAWSTETGKIDRGFGDSLRAALAAGQVDPVADSLVSGVGKPDVLIRLNETFGRELRLPESHRVLSRIPFCAALTTNFDTLLERTYPDATGRVVTPRNADRFVEMLGRREFFIGKLYGTLSVPDSVLVAPADYAEAVSRNLPFSQWMEGLFVSRTLLFVGASLEGIEAYLSGLTFRGQMTRPHYALVAVLDAGWRAKADLLRRRYGIEVLPFTPGASFEEIPQFLEKLARAVATADEPDAAPRRSATEGLKRLRLLNIGPFPELDLELQSDWNVILGDNGVGKSSILKAIAICFCGKDAAPYAARLIRSGETSGSIVLETARNTYRMELRRKDHSAEISVVPARPLEVEGVLALGFPPLRAVSWERPKGPTSEGLRRPAVEDLLPIVKAEPDPRLDKLKQWIVNLDARIHYERTQGGDDRYERLLARFFEIVDRVTPGMSIRFGRVNQDTREVTVITDDGEIPIEMVSQGSVSLMGWIGILLQRLYEVYGSEEDPSGRYALVLIDEIDAHMHPEWQQSVIEDMTAIFPNVQYVATTHSPLVVGGMEGRQVMRFVRNPGSKTTRVPVTDEMLVGRADQILTGRLFGMKTTLDSQTQRAMDRYKTLLGQEQRNPTDEDEFQRLHRDLKFKIPLAEETAPERKALALVEAIINDQLSAILPQARQPLVERARDLINEVNMTEKSAL